MTKQIIQRIAHIGVAGMILGLNGFFFLYSEKPVVSGEIFCAKIAVFGTDRRGTDFFGADRNPGCSFLSPHPDPGRAVSLG